MRVFTFTSLSILKSLISNGIVIAIKKKNLSRPHSKIISCDSSTKKAGIAAVVTAQTKAIKKILMKLTSLNRWPFLKIGKV